MLLNLTIYKDGVISALIFMFALNYANYFEFRNCGCCTNAMLWLLRTLRTDVQCAKPVIIIIVPSNATLDT